ncbi:hypothetical protein BKA83DRAFT_617303 [Pisolithus microcarpus]|nr:hypothetical protein BKA83DRAFT_617303 [Pisolithus microcarpus]
MHPEHVPAVLHFSSISYTIPNGQVILKDVWGLAYYGLCFTACNIVMYAMNSVYIFCCVCFLCVREACCSFRWNREHDGEAWFDSSRQLKSALSEICSWHSYCQILSNTNCTSKCPVTV